MLEIIEYIDNFYLKNRLWSGALDTIEVIIKNGKTQELMYLLEELYPEPVNITTINDLLWFDSDYIFEILGIKVDENEKSSASFCI